MTATATLPVSAGRSSRWLLLGSLALNLFFVGIAIAMAVREPSSPPTERNVFARAERIAATLPQADGNVLREAINANRPALDSAQVTYRAAQEKARAALRREPFSNDELRAAMVQTRTTRQGYDQVLQGTFADAAAKMSPAGRQALAAWPPNRNAKGRP